MKPKPKGRKMSAPKKKNLFGFLKRSDFSRLAKELKASPSSRGLQRELIRAGEEQNKTAAQIRSAFRSAKVSTYDTRQALEGYGKEKLKRHQAQQKELKAAKQKAKAKGKEQARKLKAKEKKQKVKAKRKSAKKSLKKLSKAAPVHSMFSFAAKKPEKKTTAKTQSSKQSAALEKQLAAMSPAMRAQTEAKLKASNPKRRKGLVSRILGNPSTAKAKADLKRSGKVTWGNAEIWETVGSQGQYTGRYRVSPKGSREDYRSAKSIAEAFRIAKTFNQKSNPGGLKEAKAALKKYGKVTYCGVEIWETYGSQGQYTGRYRVAPAGSREDFESAKSIAEAFRIAARSKSNPSQSQRGAGSTRSEVRITRKGAAKKATKLEAKAKLLRAKAARPTVRQRIKKGAAKKAHGLVSRLLGNPSQIRLPETDGTVRLKGGRYHCTHGSPQHPICRDCADAMLDRAARGQFGDPDIAYEKTEKRIHGKSNPSQSQRGAGSTRSEVRSPTKTEVRSPTSTSTHAKTTGNFTATVTGGAGAGATNVKIYTRGKKGNPGRFVVKAYQGKYAIWDSQAKDYTRGVSGKVAAHSSLKSARELAAIYSRESFNKPGMFKKPNSPKRRNSNTMRARGAVVASSNPSNRCPGSDTVTKGPQAGICPRCGKNVGYKRAGPKGFRVALIKKHQAPSQGDGLTFSQLLARKPNPSNRCPGSNTITKGYQTGICPVCHKQVGFKRAGTKGFRVALIKSHAKAKSNPKRRNGESGADAMRSKFVGRKTAKRPTMLAANGTPKRLAALGKLTCIQLRGHAPLNFDEKEAPMLAVNPAGDHLYIVGGKGRFAKGISGKLEKVGYLARKNHIGNGGTFDYRHKFETAPSFSVDAEGFGKISKARYTVTGAGIEG